MLRIYFKKLQSYSAAVCEVLCFLHNNSLCVLEYAAACTVCLIICVFFLFCPYVVSVTVVVVCTYSSSFIFVIIKKLYVFGWPAWLTSGFSGNLALFNVVYCHIHCDCVEPHKFLLLLRQFGILV